MDGVSWSTTRPPESFSRSKTTTDTLSRLASFIARADTKQQRIQRPETPHVTSYACQECDQDFLHTEDLLQHQEATHTLPKPHRCASCGQAFSLRSSLTLHTATCYPACTTRTSVPVNLKDNSPRLQPRLLDASPYACAPCGRGFSQKQALLHHQQAGCSEPPSTIIDVSNLPDDSPPGSEGDSAPSDSSDTPLGASSRALSECEICSRSFRTQTALQRHKQTTHGEERQTKEGGEGGANVRVNGAPMKRSQSKNKLLSCRSCDQVFRNTSKLYLHRKEKHSREKVVSRESRPVHVRRRRPGAYPCQVCGKVFVHHLSLRAHYKHHSDLSYTAIQHKPPPQGGAKEPEHRPNTVQSSSAGNKTVRAGPGRPRKLLRGRRRVTEADVCGGKEEEPGGEAEPEEEEFPCPSCAEVFSAQSLLREHVELHQSSVRRRRRCSVCTHNMDTSKRRGLKRHRLYHCVPCKQGFSTLDSFLEHCQEHLRARVEEDGLTEGDAPPARKA